MLPNIDPKKMEQMMRQMGINSKQINAKTVKIETDDGNLIITNPQVTEITMQGQKSYQISGNVSFEESVKEEDIKLIMEQAGCSKEQAIEALKKTKGDIAEAILILQKKSDQAILNQQD